jgi:hypothetical protein
VVILRKVLESRLAVGGVLAAIVIGVATACVFCHPRFSFHEIVFLAFVILLAIGGALFQLRHLLLALATALAPAVGLLAAAPFAHGASLIALTLAYLTGLSVSLYLADEILLRVADGAGSAEAFAVTLRQNLVATLAAVTLSAIIPSLLLFVGGGLRGPMRAALLEAGAGIAAIVVLPLAASLFSFGEDTIARVNRLREWRERAFEKLTFVSEMRWGWSLTGITAVFTALGLFGARTLRVLPVFIHSPMQVPVGAVAILAVIAAGAAATRDWRRTLGVVGALGLVDVICAWGYARTGVALTGATWLALLQTVGLAATLILLAANAGRAEPSEDTSAAISRAVATRASPILTASTLAVLTLSLQSFAIGGEAIALIIAVVFAAAGAIALQPALTLAVESMIPRRGTIDARYRVN